MFLVCISPSPIYKNFSGLGLVEQSSTIDLCDSITTCCISATCTFSKEISVQVSMALLHRGAGAFGLPRLSAPRIQSRKFVCTARKYDKEEGEEKSQSIKGIAAAALAASFILASAGAGPAEAARSGGRAGGSSFRSSAPRASAQRSAPSVQNRTYNNYNVNPSPPLFGGFGGGFGGGYGYGFGGPGISFFPTFVTPIGGGGGIFQLFFVVIIASTILGAIRAIFSGGRRRNDYDD